MRRAEARARNRGAWRRARRLIPIAIVLALAACQPIVIGEDGRVVSSSASYAVDPVTVRVGGTSTAAIQIRLRDCQQVELRRPSAEPMKFGMRPHAKVTDATGKVIYFSHDFLDQPQVRPAGSYEAATTNDGSYHIVTPVAGAKAPLKIQPFCDAYTVGSHGLYPIWTFPTCSTSTRRCAATAKGVGTWSI